MRTGILLIILSAAVFPLAEEVLRWFQVRTAAPLAAFGIADAFLALVTIALGAGAVAAVPYAAWEVLCAAAKIFPELTVRTRWLFWSASILLFFSGLCFCIRITLPYGSRFLLSYGSERLQPVICVRQFVSFCLVFTLGFGALFELPLVMTLLAWLKVATSSLVRRFRGYAIVLITIVAAVVTPTPDLVNLLLLAVPLYLLFELGILGMRLCERRRQSVSVMDSIPA
jgi:sec-independent protein translocase protein TatC